MKLAQPQISLFKNGQNQAQAGKKEGGARGREFLPACPRPPSAEGGPKKAS